MKKLVSFVSAFIIGFNLVYPFIYAQELDNNIIEDEIGDIIENEIEDIIEDGNPVINDEIIENISDNSEDSKELDDIIDDDNNNELSVNNVDEINENSVEDSDFTFNELVEGDEKVEGEKDTIQTYSIDEGKNNIETFGEGDEPEVFTVSFDTDGGTPKDSITVASGEILIKDVTKHSHTSNISDDGTRNGVYEPNLNFIDVITITGSISLDISIKYGIYGPDTFYLFSGKYYNWDELNLESGWIERFSYNKDAFVHPFNIQGDSITFAFYSNEDVGYYGYYAVITGTQNLVGKNPTKEGKNFIGWFKESGEQWDLSGDIVNEDITLYAKWRDPEATLIQGELFNTAIKSLTQDGEVSIVTPNNSIKGFEKSKNSPSDSFKKEVISTDDSETSIIARYDKGIIYYYSDAGNIYLNPDSSAMFSGLSALESVDMNIFDASKVESMSSMFENCINLTGLELTEIITNSVTNMSKMFLGAENLKTVYVSLNNFSTNNVSYSDDMFNGAISIRGGNGTIYDGNHTDKEYARIDNMENSGYFTDILDKPYSILYNLDGGILNGGKESYTARESFILENPVKTGYIFVGWTGSNGTEIEIEVNIPAGTTGDLEYNANWKVDTNNNGIADDEEYYTIIWIDGNENVLKTDIMLLGNTPVYTGQTPTKSSTSDYNYIFNGNWYPEVSIVTGDIQYNAQFDEKFIQKSGGNSSGGGGRKSTNNIHGSADSLIQSGVKGDEKFGTGNIISNFKSNTGISEPYPTSGNYNGDISTQSLSDGDLELQSGFSQEFIDAYNFSKKYGITTANSMEEARMYSPLTRIQMAKMLSFYAINVLGKEPDISKGMIKFSDVSNKLNYEYGNAVTLAYQLGIMGQNVKDNKFRPNDEVTRAEFVTALSRLLFGGEERNNESTKKYYEPHIVKLYNEGIINNTNPNIVEKRGYVMIMLMR